MTDSSNNFSRACVSLASLILVPLILVSLISASLKKLLLVFHWVLLSAFPQLLRKPLLLLLILLGPCLPAATSHASDLAALQQLASVLNDKSSVSSYALLVRHALAPGTGDPAEFSVDDCSTQRNLNEEGRRQSGKIGQLLKQAGLGGLDIFTSQWCRCRETAVLLRGSFLASTEVDEDLIPDVADLPVLNSFFRDYERREPRTEELHQWLVKRSESSAERLAVLVSHQVNITAISGVYPASGEIVIVKTTDGEIEIIGSVETL